MINHVKKAISNIFGMETRTISLLDDIDFAFDPVRDQYYSTVILEKLANMAPAGTKKILGITKEDLFIPILTHVYGEAQLGGMACIVSLSRLMEGIATSRKKYYGRVSKEAIHELGHTFNLRHCRDQSCIMHYCRTIDDVDKKSEQFCRYCKVLLEDAIKII